MQHNLLPRISNRLPRTALSLNKALTKQAVAHLHRVDPVMSRLIEAHGSCSIWALEYRPFDTLVSSIISQQLSAKAADTIKRRINQIVPKPFMPGEVLQAKVEHLRAAGLSGAKVRYIRELAERVSDGRLAFDELSYHNNEAVVGRLVEVPGIGRWTAEMFLIFGLKRPDVLATTDAGLQRAAMMLYGATNRKEIALEKLSKLWKPFRSVASWYLWQHLDNDT